MADKQRKTEHMHVKMNKKLLDHTRGKTRVNIGEAFERWRDLRTIKDLKRDEDVALFLLDIFSSRESITVPKIEWTVSDESTDSASESELTQDEATVSTVRQCSRQTEDEQKKTSSEDEDGSSDYESCYVNLNKEVLVLLMFRCLDCSSDCLVQGKGKGGNLCLRQECLVCCNYRVWSSQPANRPKDKVADICLTRAQCDDEVLKTDQNVNSLCKLSTDSEKTLQEEEDAAADVSTFVVKKENDDGRREEESLLMETYEDNVSVFSGKRKDKIEDEGFNVTPAEQADNKTDQYETFIDEDDTVQLPETVNNPSSDESQPNDFNENLLSSCDPTDDSEEECFLKYEWKKPFQNTIKPVIWCVDCGAVTKMLCRLQRHKKIYGCADCGAGDAAESCTFQNFSVHFSDIKTFHLHAMDVHGATENLYEHVTCKDCNKSIRVSQKDHVCEYKIKPFSCQLCRKRFFSEIGQKVHHRRLHGDYTHICKFCMSAFNTKTSKLEHELTHDLDQLPYICPDCPEKFKDFITRNQHLKSHRGQKKYTCHTCNRKFSGLTRYERHLLIHSGEKPYTCEVCERSFNQLGHLKSHMRLHTGEKPFMCEECGECFNHNISLRNHQLRRHSLHSAAVLSEENKQKGRPVSHPANKDQQKKRVRKSSATAAEEEEEDSPESDSDGEQQKTGRERKARRKKRVKRQNYETMSYCSNQKHAGVMT